MKWLKLTDGALFNLESVMYICVNEKSCGMITMDGDAEWNKDTVRQVWAALQEPNTVCGLCAARGVYDHGDEPLAPPVATTRDEILREFDKKPAGLMEEINCRQNKLTAAGLECHSSHCGLQDRIPTESMRADWQCNCGKKHYDINLSKPFSCTCGLPLGTPRK